MKAVPAIVFGLLLAGCTGEEFGDLKAELKDKTKDLRGRIDPLPVVKPYEPVPYKAFDQADPFSSAKIELVTKSASSGRLGAAKQHRKFRRHAKRRPSADTLDFEEPDSIAPGQLHDRQSGAYRVRF